jgi:hypothetical protein
VNVWSSEVVLRQFRTPINTILHDIGIFLTFLVPLGPSLDPLNPERSQTVPKRKYAPNCVSSGQLGLILGQLIELGVWRRNKRFFRFSRHFGGAQWP